jgi:hypothetical protein
MIREAVKLSIDTGVYIIGGGEFHKAASRGSHDHFGSSRVQSSNGKELAGSVKVVKEHKPIQLPKEEEPVDLFDAGIPTEQEEWVSEDEDTVVKIIMDKLRKVVSKQRGMYCMTLTDGAGVPDISIDYDNKRVRREYLGEISDYMKTHSNQ